MSRWSGPSCKPPHLSLCIPLSLCYPPTHTAIPLILVTPNHKEKTLLKGINLKMAYGSITNQSSTTGLSDTFVALYESWEPLPSPMQVQNAWLAPLSTEEPSHSPILFLKVPWSSKDLIKVFISLIRNSKASEDRGKVYQAKQFWGLWLSPPNTTPKYIFTRGYIELPWTYKAIPFDTHMNSFSMPTCKWWSLDVAK